MIRDAGPLVGRSSIRFPDSKASSKIAIQAPAWAKWSTPLSSAVSSPSRYWMMCRKDALIYTIPCTALDLQLYAPYFLLPFSMAFAKWIRALGGMRPIEGFVTPIRSFGFVPLDIFDYLSIFIKLRPAL
jgi:hypothetical protein